MTIDDCGLRIADCGLRIADCRLGIADWRLGIGENAGAGRSSFAPSPRLGDRRVGQDERSETCRQRTASGLRTVRL